MPDRLDTERLTLDELKEAARLEGYGDLAEIDYAVLETDGKLSFIPARKQIARRALAGPPLCWFSLLVSRKT